jgi:hypothetical protein
VARPVCQAVSRCRHWDGQALRKEAVCGAYGPKTLKTAPSNGTQALVSELELPIAIENIATRRASIHAKYIERVD